MEWHGIDHGFARVSHPTSRVIGKISLPGSKSESNRLLILSAVFSGTFRVDGLSTAEDTNLLKDILTQNLKEGTIDCRMAGTTLRFLTAYYAARPGCRVVLTGARRMQHRPIGPLVDALRQIGADIEYLSKPGYPPLLIRGTHLSGGQVEVDGSTSSQFISALMLIGCALPDGLRICIKGAPVSVPYIYLTAASMWQVGLRVDVRLPEILLYPSRPKKLTVRVEPDWSSASYWYLIALLSRKAEIYLPGLRLPSMQGDAAVRGYFEALGVETVFLGSGIRLRKSSVSGCDFFRADLRNNPDLAQTLAVALSASGRPGLLTGLDTLPLKETDRIAALHNELSKYAVNVRSENHSLEIRGKIQPVTHMQISTYGDHRMAMAFAPIGLLYPVEIQNPGVVSKSYPTFWADLRRVGFEVTPFGGIAGHMKVPQV
ncbi:MAG: 3-phosphoshikimate 1-carboxyvinyltransferase [Thermaurantimonas sp.]